MASLSISIGSLNEYLQRAGNPDAMRTILASLSENATDEQKFEIELTFEWAAQYNTILTVAEVVDVLWGARAIASDVIAARTAWRQSGNSGSGFGNWPRSDVQIDQELVIRQVDSTSCGQACGAMVLRDRGIDVQPTDIGTGLSSFQIGSPNSLANQISSAAPGINWATGHAEDLHEAFNVLTRPSGGSWIAELRGVGSVNHAVVVDRVSTGGVVHVRDPWDQTTYTMSRRDFLNNWTGGFVGQ